MVKDELGTKRTCPSCAARFYDLMKSPIQCPKCSTVFTAEVLLPSKGEGGAAVKMRPAPVPVEVEEVADVEIVSLEEVEEPGGDEDEAAAIPDVDLGEDVAVEDEADVFLEEEEEDGDNVTAIIGGGGEEEEP